MITGTVVRDALAAVRAVGGQLRSFDELAAGADAALRQAPPGLTPDGAAAFLATCAVESAWFRTTVEYGSGQRYAPHIGRTFVQVTWLDNYRAFGKWCHGRGLVADPERFVRDPVALGAYDYAWLGPVWYFESTDLWGWANGGDFRRVSQAVNGGRGRAGTSFTPNGWDERQAMYRVFQRAGAALLPGATSTPARPAPDQEDDDMGLTPAQATQLAEIHTQLLAGWPSWNGGSRRADGNPDQFTPVDYLRKANQAGEDNRRDVAALHRKLDELLAARAAPAAGGGLTADEVRQILREALASTGPLYLTTQETPR